MDFVNANPLQCLQSMRREDLDGTDPAKIPPVIAVRRPRDGGVVMPKVFSCEQLRPVGEDGVVFSKALLRNFRRGDEKNRARAELEEEDRAVTSRDFGKSAVEGLFEEVEMADYGEGERMSRGVIP